MLFLEPWFWIFAGAVIPLYWLCPQRFKAHWLLGVCAVFHYHFAGPAGMAPIIVLATLTYAAALGVSTGRLRYTFTATWLVVVGTLAFYKYSGLLLSSGVQLLGAVDLGAPTWMQQWRTPAAPLGISFFTFEFVHYLYEVRVRKRQPIRNPLHFSLFAIFFPSLAAGPIKRFPDFVPQLEVLQNPPASAIWPATQRLIRGLFKKVCIADLLVEYVKALENLPHYNIPTMGGLAMLQGFRIYYDFAGYSDIAIALAQMIGLRLPENFDRPYWSTSLQEFWRCWHMSLTAWIRDYIYIPLGGNRTHRALNLMVALILCGLWHGAAWHFALWGIYHGTGLALETAARRRWPQLFGGGIVRKVLGWTVCYSYVTYGWPLFFYPAPTVYTMTKEALQWRCTF